MTLLPSPTWARIVKDLLIYLRETEQNLNVVTEFFFMALRLIVSASWLWSEQLSWTLAFWSLCLVTVPRPVNPADHVQKLLKFRYFLTAMARWLTHFSIMTLMSSQDQSACTCPLWVLHARVTFLWHLVFTCFFPQWPAKFMFCLHSYNILNCPLD